MGVSELMEQDIVISERKINKDNLRDLLQKAKEAHTKFEQETGVKDKDWAGWYAEFLAKELSGESTKDELKPLLDRAAELFPGEDWSEKYAEFILNELDRIDHR